MKLSAALLVGSLAANAAIIAVFALKPTLAPAAMRDYFSSGGASTPPGPPSAAKRDVEAADRQAAAQQAKLWGALYSADLPTFVGQLRAAGFSPQMIRAIVTAQIDARYTERMAAVYREMSDGPYWKPDPTSSLGGGQSMIEKLNQLSRERSNAVRELLQGDPQLMADTATATAQRQRYGSISPENIIAVERVSQDYAEMIAQIRIAARGMMLKEDQDLITMLEGERKKDLAAILSPAEMEEYALRTSTVTSRLRSTMTSMDASEDEFRAIYRIMEPLDPIINPTNRVGALGADFMQQREAAQKQADDQIKAALGDQRYADYSRASSPEYQQLARLGKQDAIPVQTVNQAYDLRNNTSAESQRIYADTAMSVDQKRAALTALAQNTRNQLKSMLGPTSGPGYVEVAGRWLDALERGSSVTFGPQNAMSYRTLPPPGAQPPAPPRN